MHLESLFLSSNKIAKVRPLPSRSASFLVREAAESFAGIVWLMLLSWRWFSCQIEGLSTLVNLKELELGCNKIREVEGLDTLTKLESLWLGKNKITKMVRH